MEPGASYDPGGCWRGCPKWLLRRRGLSARSKLLFLALTPRTGEAMPPIPELAAELACSARQVYDCLRLLRAAGLLAEGRTVGFLWVAEALADCGKPQTDTLDCEKPQIGMRETANGIPDCGKPQSVSEPSPSPHLSPSERVPDPPTPQSTPEPVSSPRLAGGGGTLSDTELMTPAQQSAVDRLAQSIGQMILNSTEQTDYRRLFQEGLTLKAFWETVEPIRERRRPGRVSYFVPALRRVLDDLKGQSSSTFSAETPTRSPEDEERRRRRWAMNELAVQRQRWERQPPSWRQGEEPSLEAVLAKYDTRQQSASAR